jgi:hypothetical protein
MAVTDCLNQGEQITMVQDWINSFSNLEIFLTTNSQGATPATAEWSNVVEPTGTWYSRQPAKPFSVGLDANGNFALDFNNEVWVYSSTNTGTDTVYGYGVANAVPSQIPVVLLQNQLASPVTMQAEYDMLEVQPQLHIPTVSASNS